MNNLICFLFGHVFDAKDCGHYERVHTGIEPFKCSRCREYKEMYTIDSEDDYIYATNGALNKPMRYVRYKLWDLTAFIKKPLGPWICSHCEKKECACDKDIPF